MREILFRGKSTGGIDKWIEGTGVFNDGINTWISFNEPNRAIAYGIKHRTVLPETVGQFTGLTDKNGKKIFEGDVVRTDKFNTSSKYYVIKYDLLFGAFIGEENNAMYFTIFDGDSDQFEVIGNIHDNPELIGV
jgi:uncharacterized phage protein (TIGR01671 family)